MELSKSTTIIVLPLIFKTQIDVNIDMTSINIAWFIYEY